MYTRRKIAEVCHELIRAFCRTIGDPVQPTWADAPTWQRESAVNGVKFAIMFPDALPSAQHDAWLQDKVAAGWVRGPVKDERAKTHPCIVPYGELPTAQRMKDKLFMDCARALAGLLEVEEVK